MKPDTYEAQEQNRSQFNMEVNAARRSRFQRVHVATAQVKHAFRKLFTKPQATSSPVGSVADLIDSKSQVGHSYPTRSEKSIPEYTGRSSPVAGRLAVPRPSLSMKRIRKLFSSLARSKRDSVVSLDDGMGSDQGIDRDTDTQDDAGDDEDYYNDDGEPTGHANDRRDFRVARAVTRKSLAEFVLDIMSPEPHVRTRTCQVTKRTEGSFHHAVFLRINVNDQAEQDYVLKIPAHGTAEHWEEGDAFMLRNEAVLMQHIRHHTTCPVPEVIAFDNTLDNALGVPYILMKKINGMSAMDMWLGQSYEDFEGELHHNADEPTPEVEQKRLTFLSSLAEAMAQLQRLQFDKIGIPVFDKPEDEHPTSFGPIWHWHTKSSMEELTAIGPFDTTKDFFLTGLDAVYGCPFPSWYKTPGAQRMRGVRKILDICLDSEPFTSRSIGPTHDTGGANSTRETFFLRHDDLDLHNIIVDDEGKVVGIIDWDGCMTVPRFVGPVSMPLFLHRDWVPNPLNTMMRAPHMTYALPSYREIYATAMDSACMNGDAKYTRKSPMYQALLATAHEQVSCREVAMTLLLELDGFRRVDWDAFCRNLGAGWPAVEKQLKVQIAALLAPGGAT